MSREARKPGCLRERGGHACGNAHAGAREGGWKGKGAEGRGSVVKMDSPFRRFIPGRCLKMRFRPRPHTAVGRSGCRMLAWLLLGVRFPSRFVIGWLMQRAAQQLFLVESQVARVSINSWGRCGVGWYDGWLASSCPPAAGGVRLVGLLVGWRARTHQQLGVCGWLV
eukprot:354104-Chlamydomonas_euryale.AAC.1